MEHSRTSTLLSTQSSDHQTDAEDSVAKRVLESHGKHTPGQKSSKPQLSLEQKIEHEKQKKYSLIKEHNRLVSFIEMKKGKLKGKLDLLKAVQVRPSSYNDEEDLEMHTRSLENSLEKMKKKITEAKRIQNIYRGISEHLQQELNNMAQELDQKELAVVQGWAEVDKAKEESQSAAAAADSIMHRRVQVTYETGEKKREMEGELCELSAEQQELEEQKTTLGQIWSTEQSMLPDQEIEESQSTSVRDHQHYSICGASQGEMKVVEEMVSLTEALGCADVQDLVNKMVTQQVTEKQLLIDVAECEELVKQEAKILADLEVQHAVLKFSTKSQETGFDRLWAQMQARLQQEKDRIRQLQAALKQSQDLLDTVGIGVNNIYFRMSCVPVEGVSSAPCTTTMDKLRDVRARLPTLQQKTSKTKMTDQDRERICSLTEQANRMNKRNNKRPTTPVDNLEFSDDEEDANPLSREDIKRNSLKLIESMQKKKTAKKK